METKCPYFNQCDYSDIRACKDKYESCVIYAKKEKLERIKVSRMGIHFVKPKTLEGKFTLR